MSVSAEIFNFPARNGGGNGGFWGNQDLADIYRCIDQFAQQGIVLEAASGLTDEGDPWFALEDVTTGETLVHIARIDGFFIVHVMDGETWQGETLRAALTNLDFGALALGDVHVATDQGPDAHDKTDPDGSHAFLRIVSAVIAVLTADVIASTVAHDAMASPLPDVSETVAGDHADYHISHKIALPDMPDAADTPIAHSEKVQEAAVSLEPTDVPVTLHEAKQALATSFPTDDAPSAAHIDIAHIDFSNLLPIAETTQPTKVELPVAEHLIAVTVAQAQNDGKSELIHIVASDKVALVATERDDVFLVVLTQEQNQLEVTQRDFQSGHDSLVIEKTDESGTSSSIILDLSNIAGAQAGGLTVIGQTATADLPLAGG
jgi:hypothetical protein